MKKLLVWLFICFFGVVVFFKDGNSRCYMFADGAVIVDQVIIVIKVKGVQEPELLAAFPLQLVKDVRIFFEDRDPI